MIYLKGPSQEELNFDLRRILPEECGLAAAIHLPLASQHVFDCLALQEHRGEKGSGIVSLDGKKLYPVRKIGKVKRQFMDADFQSILPGTMAIGHTRYATSGDPDSLTNIQPLFFNDSKFGPFAIAHNGTLHTPTGMRPPLLRGEMLPRRIHHRFGNLRAFGGHK